MPAVSVNCPQVAPLSVPPVNIIWGSCGGPSSRVPPPCSVQQQPPAYTHKHLVRQQVSNLAYVLVSLVTGLTELSVRKAT